LRAQTLFIAELLYEAMSSGHSLVEGIDQSLAQQLAAAALGACVSGVAAAHALLPAAKRRLASATRSPLSRVLTTRRVLLRHAHAAPAHAAPARATCPAACRVTGANAAC
jgi:hypothetical protein